MHTRLPASFIKDALNISFFWLVLFFFLFSLRHVATARQVNHLRDHGGLFDDSSGPGNNTRSSALEGLSRSPLLTVLAKHTILTFNGEQTRYVVIGSAQGEVDDGKSRSSVSDGITYLSIYKNPVRKSPCQASEVIWMRSLAEH